MAEASENLKAVMARHPEIKKLAEQKETMRQALIAKGVSEDDLADFSKYADILKAFSFSIDSVIKNNGFTYNAGTEENPVTLSTVLSTQFDYCKKLADIESYKAKDFYKDNKILYLTLKPLSADMSNFCSQCTRLMYLPQFDFTNVQNLQNAFTNKSNILLDEYELDIPNCTNLNFVKFGFTKSLILKNMQNNCQYSQLFFDNMNTKNVYGMNFSASNTRVSVLFTESAVTHIEQSDDSVIRCANVLSSRFSDPETDDGLFDKFDTETLYGFCSHAYDWLTNPRNYTKIDGAISDGGLYCANYYNFRFSDAVKTKLEAAYPDVDFSAIMEAKGWIY